MRSRTSEAKILIFQEKILDWYKLNSRRFPWRKSRLSNYQYIIAEILLQRTKAETVSSFYSKFILDFPDWQSLNNADVNDIEKYLIPVGLYRQRSQRLKKLAAEMVKRNGRLPRDRNELESIPFLGQYIANAIELVIFNEPSPLLDVNMSRVLERIFGERQLADIRYDPYLQKLAYRIVKHAETKNINWAILDFAALVCKARLPLCSVCPLNNICKYLKNNYFLATLP